MTLTLEEAIAARTAELEVKRSAVPTRPSVPDVLTLASYGLGLWWCAGGPHSAGVASMILDEVDSRLARATNSESERGAMLDWGADLALTPLTAMRLGRTLSPKHGNNLALLASPALLYGQATYAARGKRPPIGSLRAAMMGATMLIERVMSEEKEEAP